MSKAKKALKNFKIKTSKNEIVGISISDIDISPFYLPNKKRKKSKQEKKLERISSVKKSVGRPKKEVKERVKKKYQNKYIYKYPIIDTKDIEHLAIQIKDNIKKEGRFTKLKASKALAQLVSKGKLSTKQAVEILSKYNFSTNKKDYAIDKINQYKIKDSRASIYEKQRYKVIKSGAYDILKKEIWRENYIKSIKAISNNNKIVEMLENVSIDDIDYLSKVLDEIGIYYMIDIMSYQELQELLQNTENTLSKLEETKNK